MPKLLILKGLPASGKSTYAKELAQKPDWKRVNRDLLREMVDGGKWNKKNEELVRAAELKLAKQFLLAGFNVVVDDTNLSQAQKDMWHGFMLMMDKEVDLEVEDKFFDISVDEAIKRDLARPISVGEKVIKRMYRDYLMPRVEPYKAPVGAPKAIVVDVDGTLAHMNGRSPYDPTKYAEDSIDPAIRDLVNRYHDLEYNVIICSGRDDTYEEETGQWLIDNGVKFDALFMRKGGDTRKDSIVKRELFDANIKGYDVEFVLDDRNQVVEMWRDLGLKVLQVAEGDF